MKQLSLSALLIFVLLPLSIQAQLNDYGLKAGIQTVGIKGQSSTFTPDRSLGFSIYGYSEWKIYSPITAELDLGYSMRGYSDTFRVTGPDGPQVIQTAKAHSQLHYLSSVFLLKANYEIAGHSFFSGAGPRFEYLVGRDPGTFHLTDIYFNDMYRNVALTDKSANLFDNTLFGLTFVSGIKNVDIGFSKVNFELKYETDLTDSMSKYPRQARNNAFTFSTVIGLR